MEIKRGSTANESISLPRESATGHCGRKLQLRRRDVRTAAICKAMLKTSTSLVRCSQNIRVAAVRILCWTANSTESSEQCAVWPHRQCPESQSGQVLGLVRTQRALPPIRNYERFECAP